jgi:predicted O-methyltransferase YrrM
MAATFLDIFESWVRYQFRKTHLIWRGGVSPDIASMMAVKGQMRREEADCLYQLAQQASPNGVIVEIGSYLGRSTIALAKGSLRGPKISVYAIDPHESTDLSGWSYNSEDHYIFLKNILLAGIAKNVKVINLFSWQAASSWGKPISLLFIDGNHQYDDVRKDFDTWSRFIIPGGYAALHDSVDPSGGPYRVIQQALGGGNFGRLKEIEKVTVLQKQKQ